MTEELKQKAKDFFMNYYRVEEDELDDDCYREIDFLAKFGDEATKELQEENKQLKKINLCGDWNSDFHTCQMQIRQEEVAEYCHEIEMAKEIIRDILQWEDRVGTHLYQLDRKILERAKAFLKDKV